MKTLRFAGVGIAAMCACAVNAKAAETPPSAPAFRVEVVASGLLAPTGLVVEGLRTIYFAQTPTPGVPGSMGGMNSVQKLDLRTGEISEVNMGEPEPTNLAITRDGELYWTCKSAGVILQRDAQGVIAPILTGLTQPNGLATGEDGQIYFTQLPTPGVPGTLGGTNTVNVLQNGVVTTLTTGEPEPTDVAVAGSGDLYWTCKSANVILHRTPEGEVSVLLSGLNKPVGIALNHAGTRLYFTEVPTPGVPGSAGGMNTVNELDLHTMQRTLVDAGDPQPTDVSVATNGNIYWTCTSAGVIVEARRRGAPRD
jgi:sugar lactone lactonase YvrE